MMIIIKGIFVINILLMLFVLFLINFIYKKYIKKVWCIFFYDIGVFKKGKLRG